MIENHSIENFDIDLRISTVFNSLHFNAGSIWWTIAKIIPHHICSISNDINNCLKISDFPAGGKLELLRSPVLACTRARSQ